MSRAPRRTRAVVATAIGLALVAGGAVLPAAAAGPTTIAPTTELDYYRDAYAGLGAHSVFEAVANERFEWLLQQPGTHAFLVGGPEAGDPTNVTDEIGHINAVAKDLGVPEVFNWDPHVDGADNPLLDVRTSTDSGVAQFRSELLGFLDPNGSVFDWSSSDAVATSPYLFLFDKDHTDSEGHPAPVVAKLSTRDLTDPAAYEAAVRAVLSAAAPQASSTFTYWKSQADAKHLAANATSAGKLGRDVAADYGSPVIAADADDEGFRIETITYPELLDLLQSDGRYVVLFGGTWCPNTRAIVNEVNAYAQDAGVEHVYQFDWHQYNDNDGASTHLDLRQTLPTAAKPTTGTPFSYLYGNVVNTYLTNLQTQYGSSNTNWITYDPTGAAQVAPADASALPKAQKLQVPTVLEYDRSNTASGAAAPVVRHWIEDEGSGLFKEYMSQLYYVQAVREGRSADLTSLRGSSDTTLASGQNALATGRTFAASALLALRSFYQGVDATAPTITGQPQPATVDAGQDATFSVSVSGTPAAQVQWQKLVDTKPSWAPLTAWTPVADGTATFTVPAADLASSGTQYRAVVTNGAGPALASATAALTVNPVVTPTDPTATSVTLAVTGTRSYGQTQSLTATVAPAAAGTVTFRDGATELGSAPVVAGTATRSVVLGLGAHAVSAQFAPADPALYAASTSAEQSVTIAPGTLAAATPKITGTAKVGVRLSAAPGAWTAGTALAYQWYSSGAAIKGATAATFTPAAAQRGHALTVHVTGRKAGYTTVVRSSAATKAVAAGTLTRATPKVAGTVKVGKKLTAKPGTWTSGTTLRYQWYAGGKAIKGATKSSLTLKSAQRGKTITVKVTGSKAGYTTVSATSKKTGKVR